MQLSNTEMNDVILSATTQILSGNRDLVNEAKKAPEKINQIGRYGEVTGTNFNRNLRTESDAYGYVTMGVHLNIQEAAKSISTMLNGSAIGFKFNKEIEKLGEEFLNEITSIENAHPKAKGHLQRRIKEVRQAANIYILKGSCLANGVLTPLMKITSS